MDLWTDEWTDEWTIGPNATGDRTLRRGEQPVHWGGAKGAVRAVAALLDAGVAPDAASVTGGVVRVE